jgi:integrase/recombinase XerD
MHSTPDPSHVRFTGPLTPFAPGFAEELSRLGYTTTSATMQMQLAAHLSRWLEALALGPGDLQGPVLTDFLVARRAGYTSGYSLRALGPILGHLRRHGVTPDAVEPAPTSPAEVLLARYREHLTGERGLSGPVAQAYSHWVTPFVTDNLDAEGDVAFATLTADGFTRFLATHLPTLSRKTAQMTACALRSFLRYLHQEHLITVPLADAVPAVAHRRLAGLPRALTASQVESLLDACDRSTPVGRRDYAVITALHRLGLRCAELAHLHLGDLDWQAGTVTIHGKGNRVDRLPMPVDVGQALVDYLRHGRPQTSSRAVFVRAAAPFTELAPSSASCIVARAARRAGLGTIHAHRLRHTTASRTLNAGASLEDVAHLLRHASPATTSIYAKTDLARLALLARPWPTPPSFDKGRS